MGEYIEEKIPKPKKGTKKMSERKALELPPENEPKTIKMAIRVKTLVIIGALLLSHGIAFWAGVKAPGAYDSFVDNLVKSRTEQAKVLPETVESKANQ